MADGKRPGGLTALAVLNFVFGGFGVLGVLALSALLSVGNSMAQALSDGKESLTSAPGMGMIYGAILFSLVSVLLMITAGVGYLGQKRFLGRTIGNAYALVAVSSTVFSLVMMNTGFGIGTLIGLIYPVLTLILLNTTFKDDLVR